MHTEHHLGGDGSGAGVILDLHEDRRGAPVFSTRRGGRVGDGEPDGNTPYGGERAQHLLDLDVERYLVLDAGEHMVAPVGDDEGYLVVLARLEKPDLGWRDSVIDPLVGDDVRLELPPVALDHCAIQLRVDRGSRPSGREEEGLWRRAYGRWGVRTAAARQAEGVGGGWRALALARRHGAGVQGGGAWGGWSPRRLRCRWRRSPVTGPRS
ncbi:hypothetical protein FB451DRAFT_1305625 [Mycena latifolia]|nr:hypothetical protein FB451DRAFT_1305625 [Mycena latifolia]